MAQTKGSFILETFSYAFKAQGPACIFHRQISRYFERLFFTLYRLYSSIFSWAHDKQVLSFMHTWLIGSNGQNQRQLYSRKVFLRLQGTISRVLFFIDVARGVFNDSFSRCIVYFHAFFHGRTTNKYCHLCTRGLSDRMAKTKDNCILERFFYAYKAQ